VCVCVCVCVCVWCAGGQAVEGANYGDSIKECYDQSVRWQWGAMDVGYLMVQSCNRWDVPLAKRLQTLAFAYDHHLLTVFVVVALMSAPFLYGKLPVLLDMNLWTGAVTVTLLGVIMWYIWIVHINCHFLFMCLLDHKIRNDILKVSPQPYTPCTLNPTPLNPNPPKRPPSPTLSPTDPVPRGLPSPTLSPTDPVPRGLLTLCPWAYTGPDALRGGQDDGQIDGFGLLVQRAAALAVPAHLPHRRHFPLRDPDHPLAHQNVHHGRLVQLRPGCQEGGPRDTARHCAPGGGRGRGWGGGGGGP